MAAPAHVIRRFSATIAKGTLKAAPITQDMSFPPMEVVAIEILVPRGPRGTVGFKIANSGLQVFPYGTDDFFVTDDEKKLWEVENANTSGSWQLIGYNTGNFPHTIEVTFFCRLLGTGSADAPAPILNSDLSQAPALQ